MRREVNNYLFVAILIVAAILVVFQLRPGFTGFAVYQQSGSGFDGVYENLVYDGSAIILNESQTSGTYTSSVLDSGDSVTWLNLTWQGTLISEVDNPVSSANYSEYPLPINFEQNLVSGSMLTVTAMKLTSEDVSLEVQDLSANVIGTFDVVSSTSEEVEVSISPVTDTSSIIITGSNSSLVAIDSVSATNPISSSLDFMVRACSDSECLNTSFQSVSDLNNFALEGQYFQYQALFEAESSEFSPTLESVVVGSSDVVTTTLTISQPTGVIDSLESIPLEFTVVGENLNCLYNVWSTSGYALLGNTTIPDCNSTSFDLDIEGEYILTLYAKGDSGSAMQTSEFSVDTTSSAEGGSEESSSETPGTNLQAPTNFVRELTADDIAPITVDAGRSQSVSWHVRNTGTLPVTICSVKPLGDFAPWFLALEDIININAGEETDLFFDVNAPSDASGSYLLSVSLECGETAVSKDFSVEVIGTATPEQESESVTGEVTSEEGTAAPVGGFAVFEGVGTGGFIAIIVVVLALVFVFVAARRMRKEGKTLKDVGMNIRMFFSRHKKF